jgi:peptidoglycan hydrolase-like protein with peptidoglycan-binding domain
MVGGAIGAAAGHQTAKSNSTEPAQTAGGIDDAMLVLLAQQSLKDKGYDAGKPDGRWGPKTEEALRSFQSANGIDATGQLDYPTMVALGITPAADSTSTQ